MPVRVEPYRSSHLFPYFFNMLSEGANRQTQSQLLHIDENDDFGILLATAQEDTIGAVTIKPVWTAEAILSAIIQLPQKDINFDLGIKYQ